MIVASKKSMKKIITNVRKSRRFVQEFKNKIFLFPKFNKVIAEITEVIRATKVDVVLLFYFSQAL